MDEKESSLLCLGLMRSAVRPLLQSVEDAISAIIDTVHQVREHPLPTIRAAARKGGGETLS